MIVVFIDLMCLDTRVSNMLQAANQREKSYSVEDDQELSSTLYSLFVL